MSEKTPGQIAFSRQCGRHRGRWCDLTLGTKLHWEEIGGLEALARIAALENRVSELEAEREQVQ